MVVAQESSLALLFDTKMIGDAVHLIGLYRFCSLSVGDAFLRVREIVAKSVLALVACVIEGQTIVSKHVVKTKGIVRMVDIAVGEGQLFPVAVLVLIVVAPLVCNAGFDTVLLIATADIDAPAPLAPCACLHIERACGLA